jgi:lysozyme family protein
MDSNFENSLNFTLRMEGGFSNTRGDHGGKTMMGITQKVFDDYLIRKGRLPQSVQSITRSEVEDIYYNGYWLKAHCQDFPFPLALAVFDFAVNSGPFAAIQNLQKVLGIIADGVYGPITKQTVTEAVNRDLHKLVSKYVERREQFMRYLATRPGQRKFLTGWLNRLSQLRDFLDVV